MAVVHERVKVVRSLLPETTKLAGLLILTAWNMTEPHRWRGYMQAQVSDRVLLLLTLVLTVFADLTIAIGVGVTVGLALRLRSQGRRDNWTPRDR